MANFRRGAAEITKAMERKVGPRFVNNLQLSKDEKVYVQFVTPMEDMITALYHAFMITGYNDKTGKEQYNHFISRKDPAFDGRDGYDPIWDKFGYTPSTRTFAVVAELEPEFETVKGKKTVVGVSLKTREWEDKDENVHVDPVFSVAIQAQSNFFGSLITWEEDSGESVTDRVWSITKRGEKKDVRYDFYPVPNVAPVDLSEVPEDSIIDLEAYLTELADLERVQDLIDPLPLDHKISNYPPNGKPTKKSEKTNKTQAKASDDDPPFEADKPKTKSGFAALKERVATDDS